MSKRKDRFVVGEKFDDVGGAYYTYAIPMFLDGAKRFLFDNPLRPLIIYELVPYAPKKRGKEQ